MPEPKQALKTLKNRLKLCLDKRQEEWEALGLLVWEEKELPMENFRKAVEEQSRALLLLQTQLEGVESLEEKAKSIREELKETQEQKKRIKEELSSLEEPLGEKLFELLNRGNALGWREAYKPVFSLVDKLKDVDSQLFQTANAVKKQGNFRAFIDKSHNNMIKKRQKVLTQSLAKQYKKSFHTALLMGAGVGEADRSDVVLLAPWFELEKNGETLKQRELNLKEKGIFLQERRKELCEGRPPAIYKGKLIKAMEGHRQDRALALQAWGEHCASSRPAELAGLEEASGIIKRIERFNQEIQKLELGISKYEIILELEKLGKQKNSLEGRSSSLEKEINSLKSSIKENKKEITRLEKKTVRLEETLQKLGQTDPEDLNMEEAAEFAPLPAAEVVDCQ